MKHLQPIFEQTPNKSQFMVLAVRFKQLHDVLYVIEATNMSHILVLAMVVGGEHHYYRKSFNSTIS
jgi:hypothetical protein